LQGNHELLSNEKAQLTGWAFSLYGLL